jgi:type VI secretion system secreted protein Hcp
MAIDAFLDFTKQHQVQNLYGEALDNHFKNCFHVKTFTFAITQKGTAATGTGLGAGKAEFDDFEFTIDTQLGSAKLMRECARGTCFDVVVLSVRKAGGGQREYLRYVFGNCIISSYSTSGDEESSDTVKFNYRRIATKYYRQLPDNNEGELDLNSQDGKSEGSYDLKTNAEWAPGDYMKYMSDMQTAAAAATVL